MLLLKRIITIVCLFFGTLSVLGDDFEDMIASCAILSKNYKIAVAASESDYAKEYLQYMTAFEMQAEKVQKVIRKLNLGKDFNFTGIAQELRRVYNTAVKSYKSGKNVSENNLAKYSIDATRLFKILLFDIKELQKIEFTTEDGGSINITVETTRRLYEFERLFLFFEKGQSSYRWTKTKADPSYKRLFENRIERMRGLAQELTSLYKKNSSGASSRYNLATETNKMLTEYRNLIDYKPPKRKQPSKYNSKKKSVSRKKKQDERNAIRQDMRLHILNIHDILRHWRSSNFLTDPPISSPDAKNKPDADPAAIMQNQKIIKKDYSRMSAEKLSSELKKRRSQILKSNTSIDGFDSKTERRYIQTLSRAERKVYQSLFKAAKDQGNETEIAARNTVMQMQMKINGKEFTTSEKEMIQILEKLDKDKKKEIVRNELKL